nr:MAG TPA: hypothetical protein [Caudoviricetes sp.]
MHPPNWCAYSYVAILFLIFLVLDLTSASICFSFSFCFLLVTFPLFDKLTVKSNNKPRRVSKPFFFY